MKKTKYEKNDAMPAETGRSINMINRKIRIKSRIVLGMILILLAGFPAGCGREEQQSNIRMGSLKGPTSLGILFLKDRAQKGETEENYEFFMAAGADELLVLMVKGELDIALVPANVAAILYQKTQGGVAVIDINTLGVLYFVTGDPEIESLEDLQGRTVYLTGKGTTPEASLRYILKAAGLEEDCRLEFKSEAAEVAAILAEDPGAVGLLPQPFVTAALIQNPDLKVVLDMNQEWIQAQKNISGREECSMVTGVTVVRKAFLEENPQAVESFLEEHAASVRAVDENVEEGARMAVEAGIVPNETIAQKAMPECNITCIAGQQMADALSAYLEVLAEFDAGLVGGELPGEDFYFRGQ